MQLRTLIIGMLAMVFGLSAAMGVYLVVSQQSARTAEAETTPIVFVTQNVSRGTSLKEDVLSLRDWPKDLIPPGAITNLEEALERSVSIPLLANEPLLETKLAARGSGRGMAALIPPGMRAVTIQTPNVATGMAGFILPGDTVDVLVTLSYTGQDDVTGGSGTLTLLQNVEILAVDQRIDAPTENVVDPRELRSVTLLVTPGEAARLNLGQNKGTLSLALRNPTDQEKGSSEAATLTGLRNPVFAQLTGGEELAIGEEGILGDEEVAEIIAQAAPSPMPQSPRARAESGLVEPVDATVGPAHSSLPPIRTLRGNVSGAVHLQPVITYY
jgi:pilus assembly protein CpaB